MKRYLALFLLSLVSWAAWAVKIEERYVMKAIEEGQIYYISPYEISSQTNKIKPLMADVTYLTYSDSVTMNISVWTPQELLADSLGVAASRCTAGISRPFL